MKTLRALIALLFVIPVCLLMLAANTVAQLFALLQLSFAWLGGRLQRLLGFLLSEMGAKRGRK